MKKHHALLLLVMIFCAPVLLVGQTEPLQEGVFKEDLTVPMMKLEGAENLTIDDVTRLALLQNLDIDIFRLEREIERKEIPIAKSIYDTNLEVNATYSHDLQERSSVVLGSREIEGLVDVSLTKKIPTGTTIKLTGNTERHSTSSLFNTLPQNYTAFTEVSVEQPILKNFFGFMDRATIKRVKINVKKFDLETLDRIEKSLSKIRNQYWELVFEFENVVARRSNLRKAQEFLKITREKMDLGLTEKPDRYAAEANVRKRVIEVLRAETDLKTAAYSLKVLLNMPGKGFILPADRPRFEPMTFDEDKEIKNALENRRDLQQKILELESQGLEKKIRFNEIFPDLNFSGSYASTGLDRKMLAAQGKPYAFDHPKYFAGFHFSWDIENREDRHRYGQAKLTLSKIEKELIQTRLKIEQEVDRALRELTLAQERVKQTQEIKRLEQKKFEEEEENFNVGRSSSKTIVDFQEDVVVAETEAIRASVDYVKAVENFYLSNNQLLQILGLTEESVSSLGGIEIQ